MNKKDVLYLLAPNIIFVAMAGVLLSCTSAFFPNQQHEQRIQHEYEELIGKVQAGTAHPKTGDLIEALGSSYKREREMHQMLAYAHDRISKNVASSILTGVALQIGIIIWRRKAAR